ncbi:MAG: GNAT family N-acetyltransferase [Ferruginibacter sp.]
MMNSIQDNNYSIREAVSSDVDAIAELHVKTFIETHGTFNAPTIDIRKWQWAEIFKQNDGSWFCFVIENDKKELIGFAKGQVYNHSDHPDFKGELNKIYVLKKYHRLGLGTLLIQHVANKFLNEDISSMLLFGDAKNSSNGFYERLGAERLYSKKGAFHGGYGWRDLEKLNSWRHG